jgi:hypothetical protein
MINSFSSPPDLLEGEKCLKLKNLMIKIRLIQEYSFNFENEEREGGGRGKMC